MEWNTSSTLLDLTESQQNPSSKLILLQESFKTGSGPRLTGTRTSAPLPNSEPLHLKLSKEKHVTVFNDTSLTWKEFRSSFLRVPLLRTSNGDERLRLAFYFLSFATAFKNASPNQLAVHRKQTHKRSFSKCGLADLNNVYLQGSS